MNSENPVFVLFDMDGVLLDTEPLYSQAINAVTTRFGHTFTWALKEKIMGRGRLAASKFLVETLALPLTPEAFLLERDGVLMELLATAQEIPGAEAFTRALHERGVKMAVATSSESGIFEHKTGLHQAWFSIFSAVVCGDDPRLTAAKPSPDIFLVAAKELGARPDQCIVVEDSPAGVQAARAAGMKVIAMPDPNLDPTLVSMADRVIRGYHEFPMEMLGL